MTVLVLILYPHFKGQEKACVEQNINETEKIILIN